MGEGEGESIHLGIEADLDESQARTQADRLADIISAAIEKAAPAIGKALGADIVKGLRGIKVPTDTFDPLDKQAKKAADNMKATFKVAADGAAERINDIGNSGGVGFSALNRRIQESMKDFVALDERADATRKTLSRTAADPKIFAVFDRAIGSALNQLRDFQEALDKGTATPQMFEQLEVALREANKTAQKEVAGIQSTLKTLTAAESKAAEAVRAERQQASSARLRQAAQEHGKFITLQQREGAQVLAETRIAGQKQLQDERQRSRSRIELVRFTFNQIKQLERGIAGVFRAGGTILGTTTSAIGASLSRLTAIFRRSDASMSDGLRGALLKRESSLSRSFSRQTDSVRRETLEQSRVIQRFEAQASTGVAGALTGRSSLGALFGGGLALGGGFAAFQGLRNGIKVGGDFVQGLAVLGAQLELTDKQMAGVRQQSIDLGNDISLPGVSALDAAQAIQILAKQFANLGSQALPAAQAAAKGVLQLSRAAGVGAEEAARVVGAAVNVFGVEASKAVDVADQVTNALTKSAGVGFEQFADAFQQAAPVFQLFVGPAESATDTLGEFNAAIAVLAKGGLIGSAAGTGLKQLFIQANRGGKDVNEVIDGLIQRAGETGSIFFDAAGNARTFAKSLDILRRGTEGLTDAARNADLQKLFGSRATTVASLLLNTSAADFNALTTAVTKQGSAAKIAAAQNTGLRGALDALGSVIETQQIKTYERYQGVLGKVIIKFAELLNAFFEGKGKLGVLRDALLGAAAALGGLLAAKAVGEAFQFMAIGVRAVLTPLGIFIASAVALGAIFNVLRTRSPEFADAVSRLGRTLERNVAPLLGRVTDGLERFAHFAGDTAAPLVDKLATFLARNLNSAVEAVSSFITDTALPALRRFVGFIDGTVIPTLSRWADVVRDGVIGGLDRLRALFAVISREVGPLIQPAVKGFEQLREAIEAIFRGGDFSTLLRLEVLPGLRTLGTGAAGALAGVGGAIVDALRPQLGKVGDFIGDFFSGKGGTAGAKGGKGVETFLLGPFQRAVEALGFFLGNIASDPRVVDGLEKIAGLAILTGVSFIKGVGKGIGDNLPALAKLLTSQLQALLKVAFRKAFDPRAIANFVVSGLGAALIGVALVRSLSRPTNEAGRKVGQGFVRSFATAVKTTATTAVSGTPFTQGFFGGFTKTAQDAAKKASSAVQTEFTRLNRNLNRLGQVGVLPTGFGKGIISDQDLALARQRMGEIEKTVGRAATAGALLRQQLGDVGRSVGGIFRGVGTAWSGDIQTGTSQVKASFGKLRTNLGDAFRNIQGNLRATGVSIGQVIGGSIISGVGAALAGKQLGTANSAGGKAIGLAGVVASALFAGATVGGPAGAVIGGAVLSIGLLTAAFQKNNDAAKATTESIKAYVDIIEQFDSVADSASALSNHIADLLLDQGGGVQKLLTQSGFNVRSFTDDAISKQATLASVIRGLTRGLKVDQRRVDDFVDAELRLGHSGSQAIDDLNNAIRGRTTITQADALGAELRKNSIDGTSLITILETLFATGGEVETAIGRAAAKGGLLSTNVGGAAAQAAIPMTNLRDLMNDIVKIQPTSASGLGLFSHGNARADIELAATSVDNVRTAIQNLNEQRTTQINERIGELTTKLDAARQAADDALQSVLDLINNPLNDPFQQSFDQLLTGVGDIGSSLQEQLSKGIDLSAIGDLTSAVGADLRNTVKPFADAFQQAVSTAITDNPGITPDQLRDKFQPIFDQIKTGKIEVPVDVTVPDFDEAGNQIGSHIESQLTKVNLPPEAQKVLTDTLNSILQNPALETGLKNVTLANESIQAITDQIANAQARLEVKVHFSPAQIRQALIDAGLNPDLTDVFINSVPQAGAFVTDTFHDNTPGASHQSQVDAQAAIAAAQATARDQATATGNMQRSADALAGAAQILADAVSKPPVVNVAIPPGPIPVVTTSLSGKISVNRLASLSGAIKP